MAGGKKTALIVCPGRGSYTKSNSVIFRATMRMRAICWPASMPGERRPGKRRSANSTVPALQPGDIHARRQRVLADILLLVRGLRARHDEIDIVAVTGNSMGWYGLPVGTLWISPMRSISSIRWATWYTTRKAVNHIPLTHDEWQPDVERRKSLDGAVTQMNRKIVSCTGRSARWRRRFGRQ